MATGDAKWFYNGFSAVLAGIASFYNTYCLSEYPRVIYKLGLVHDWTPNDAKRQWSAFAALECTGAGYTEGGKEVTNVLSDNSLITDPQDPVGKSVWADPVLWDNLALDQVPSHAILYAWGTRAADGFGGYIDTEYAIIQQAVVAYFELGVATNGTDYEITWDPDYGMLNLSRAGDTLLP